MSFRISSSPNSRGFTLIEHHRTMAKYTQTTAIVVLCTLGLLTQSQNSIGQPLSASPQPIPTPSKPNSPPPPTLLDSHGDALPSKALARLGSVRLRHAGKAWEGGVECIAFARDGKSFFTLGAGNAIRQWDAITGKLIRPFGDSTPLGTELPTFIGQVGAGKFEAEFKTEPSCSLTVSSTGNILAASLPNGHVSLWDIATGKLLHQWKTITYALTFLPDGKTLAAPCPDHRLRAWDIAKGKEIRTDVIGKPDENGPVPSILSSNGKILATIKQRKLVQLWDVSTGKMLRQIPSNDDKNASHSFFSAAFSPDGRCLVTTQRCRDDILPRGQAGQEIAGAVDLWDVATGKQLSHIVTDKAGTNCVAFSPDGKILATGSVAGPICLWDVATGKELRQCHGYRAHVLALAFSPDSKRLVSAVSGNDQTARIWEVATGKEVTPALGGHTAPVLSLTFTPDGKSLVSGGRDGRVCLWDAESGREQRQPTQVGDFQAVAALSTDGATIATVANSFTPRSEPFTRSILVAPTIIGLWEIAKGQKRQVFPGADGCAQSMALSPDGKLLLSINLRWSGQGAGPLALAQLPIQFDSRLWDLANGKKLEWPNLGKVCCAAFSSDNSMLAAGGEDGVVIFWEVETGKKLHFDRAHTSSVRCLAFSPDSQRLVSVGESLVPGMKQPKLAIRMWHRKGSKGWVLDDNSMITKHEGKVYALAISPDGRSIASAGDKGTIHVWETATSKERYHFTGHQGQIWCLAFSSDGRRIASGSNDTTILVWDVTDRLDHGRLRPIELTAQSLEQLWMDLASSDASKAGQTVWILVSAPEAALAFLKKQLVPVPVVKGFEQRIAQLIQQLDDDVFQVRKKALSELMKLGEAAEPALRKALESSVSAEAKNRIKQMLSTIEKAKANTSQEDCRRIRALEVLEQCGTPAARQWLEALAKGEPTALLTREAQASLARLSLRAARRP